MMRLQSSLEFPHEIGIFLGYPPADVDGFMHRKEDCRISGLWKVYDDIREAEQRICPLQALHRSLSQVLFKRSLP